MDYEANTQHYQGNVTVEENKMKCVFVNSAKIDIAKIHVDGGLIKHTQERCDYIVYWEQSDEKYVFYIELKGSDIAKAINQLISTITLTTEKFSQFDHKNCVIVCSRYPQEDSTIQRLKLKLKKMGYHLSAHTRKFEYTI